MSDINIEPIINFSFCEHFKMEKGKSEQVMTNGEGKNHFPDCFAVTKSVLKAKL